MPRARWLKPPKGGGSTLLVLGAVTTLIFIALIAASYRPQWKVTRGMNHWVETPCRIIQSTITATSTYRSPRYNPYVRYNFVFADETYDGNRFSFGRVDLIDRADVEFLLRSYAIGGVATCYVNPANPRDSVLTKQFFRQNQWLVLAYGAGLLDLFWVLAAVQQSWARRREQSPQTTLTLRSADGSQRRVRVLTSEMDVHANEAASEKDNDEQAPIAIPLQFSGGPENFLKLILERILELHASEIEIQAQDSGFQVRCRVDNTFIELTQITPIENEALATHFKGLLGVGSDPSEGPIAGDVQIYTNKHDIEITISMWPDQTTTIDIINTTLRENN